jgi:hypothetical protein
LSSCTSSVRSRSRVRGVRRSWDIAAIMRVRSSLKRRSRSRMRLNASINARTSRGPRGETRGASAVPPSCSTAAVSSDTGLTSRRAAKKESTMPSRMETTNHAANNARENSIATGSTAGSGSRLLSISSQWPSLSAISIRRPVSVRILPELEPLLVGRYPSATMTGCGTVNTASMRPRSCAASGSG